MGKDILMTQMIMDNDLKKIIRRNPRSQIAAAYRLGRKEMSLELTLANRLTRNEGKVITLRER